jgi:hypothetical protein
MMHSCFHQSKVVACELLRFFTDTQQGLSSATACRLAGADAKLSVTALPELQRELDRLAR